MKCSQCLLLNVPINSIQQFTQYYLNLRIGVTFISLAEAEVFLMNNILDTVWWVNFKFFYDYLTYVGYIANSVNYLSLSSQDGNKLRPLSPLIIQVTFTAIVWVTHFQISHSAEAQFFANRSSSSRSSVPLGTSSASYVSLKKIVSL